MSIKPRVVVVHRRTEYDELLATHGTQGQAAFFLSTRGRDIAELEDRHRLTQTAIAAAVAGIPVEWRRGTVERGDVSRFLFAPDDVIVVVGQDGLVANRHATRAFSSRMQHASSEISCTPQIKSPSERWCKRASTTGNSSSH